MTRILFAGASGYGNVGDDAYRAIYQHELGKNYELRFHSPYPDLEAVAWADALVIGGGGLIYCNKTAHFSYMKMYMDAAIEMNKPIAFSSIGVQLVMNDTPRESEGILKLSPQIEPWASYLKRAISITVRNPLDAQVIKNVAPTSNPQVFPDLCYAFPVVSNYQLVGNNAYVIIPLPFSLKRHGIDYYKAYIKKAKDKPCYLLALSLEDQEVVKELQSVLHLQEGKHTLRNLTPMEVVNSVMVYAEFVLTDRYHGLVLAKAAGVQNVINDDRRYKSAFEPNWENPKKDALGHTQVLRESLGITASKTA